MPFFILKLGLARIVRMYASEPVLTEYQELLHRKSYPLNKRRATLLLQAIRSASTIVKPVGRLSETSDPDDNIFLECALAAKARYLITGNARDFPARLKYTDVITPRMFINVWKDLYRGGGPRV
jgi:putative PIN family toxin of toxin-antitoxin system